MIWDTVAEKADFRHGFDYAYLNESGIFGVHLYRPDRKVEHEENRALILFQSLDSVIGVGNWKRIQTSEGDNFIRS